MAGRRSQKIEAVATATDGIELTSSAIRVLYFSATCHLPPATATCHLPPTPSPQSQGLHLPVQVTSLQPEHFGRAADVAVVFVELLQDVIALVRGARLMERGSLAPAALRLPSRTPVRQCLRSKRDVVGFMITMRSITLRSSRTLPGRNSASRPRCILGDFPRPPAVR